MPVPSRSRLATSVWSFAIPTATVVVGLGVAAIVLIGGAALFAIGRDGRPRRRPCDARAMARPRTMIAVAAAAIAIASVCACGGPPPNGEPARPALEPPPPPDLELVESLPVETTLEHMDIPDAFDVWPAMIGAARRSVDVAQFYVSDAPGKRLEPVVAALEAAIARGVTVHLLVERSFEKVYPDTLARLRGAGAEVRSLDLGPVTGGILHAKYFIVDRREAYLGSQNFDWRALEHIQELGARVRVPAVVEGLSAIFAHDWAFAAGAAAPALAPAPAPASGAPPPPAPAPGAATIRLVASPQPLLPPGVAWDLPQLIDLIDRAKRNVRLQALTYQAADRDGAPWTELEDALRRAAARGVRIELLLANWSKRRPTIGGLQQLARTSGIDIRLISIPEWSGGFIPYARVAHTKLLAVDGRAAWLGTSNWEKSYFYRSRNVGLVIEDPALAARIDRFFETGWTSRYTERLDPDATYEPPRIQ